MVAISITKTCMMNAGVAIGDAVQLDIVDEVVDGVKLDIGMQSVVQQSETVVIGYILSFLGMLSIVK